MEHSTHLSDGGHRNFTGTNNASRFPSYSQNPNARAVFASVSAMISINLCFPCFSEENDTTLPQQTVKTNVQPTRDHTGDSLYPLRGIRSLIIGVFCSEELKRSDDAIADKCARALAEKLRAVGIKVLIYNDNPSLDKAPLPELEFEGAPMLSISVYGYKSIGTTTIVSVCTDLKQSTYLTHETDAVLKDVDLHRHFFKATSKQIDEFICEWARQNKYPERKPANTAEPARHRRYSRA